MAEFERVPLRPRPKRDWLPTAIAAVAVLLGVAVLKPWDFGRPDAGIAGASALPTFFVRPTERTGPRPYDPILFGNREPDPAWELWPAGYVVEFGMSGPVRVRDGGSPAPVSSASPSTGPTRSPAPGATHGTGKPTPAPTATPVEDGVVDLGTTDHLVALGINSPANVRIETVTLARLTDDATTAVPTVRLPTYWESTHFVVIAPEDPASPGQATPWRPGLYRLTLTTAFGEVRQIDLRVRPGAE